MTGIGRPATVVAALLAAGRAASLALPKTVCQTQQGLNAASMHCWAAASSGLPYGSRYAQRHAPSTIRGILAYDRLPSTLLRSVFSRSDSSANDLAPSAGAGVGATGYAPRRRGRGWKGVAAMNSAGGGPPVGGYPPPEHLHGIFAVYKPKGFSSADVVQKIKVGKGGGRGLPRCCTLIYEHVTTV